MNDSGNEVEKRSFAMSALSTLGTPWLIFVASALPLYLANQEELRFQLSVLGPFLIIGGVIWMISVLAFPVLRRTKGGQIILWSYYLAGPVFLGFVSLSSPQSNGLVVLGLVAIGVGIMTLGAFLLAKRVTLAQAMTPIAVAACAFIAIDLFSLVNAYQRPVDVESSFQRDAGELSALPNIYHVIFDEYQTDMFELTLDATIEQDLSGFTYFPNNSTSFGRTRMALPTILTGRKYDFKSPQVEFQRAAFSSSISLLSHLKKLGYTTEAYAQPVYDFPLELFDRVTFHKSDLPYGNSQLSETFFELWIYANFPARVAKSMLGQELLEQYQNQNVLNPEAPIVSRDSFRSFVAFEEDRSAQGRYVFVHLILPHFPNVLASNCAYDLQGGRTTPTAQSQCANQLMVELVTTLKSLGRFDNSVIIFQADHGSRYRVTDGKLRRVEHLGVYSEEWSWARSRALLLMKPPLLEQAPLVRSAAPSTLLDIAPSIMASLNQPLEDTDGFDLFADKMPSDRVRFYHFFEKKGKNGWTDKMVRYQIFADRIDRVAEIALENNPKP